MSLEILEITKKLFKKKEVYVTLSQKQEAFAPASANLILKAIQMGYRVTLGEAWRSDETAKLDAEEGKGVVNSVHRLRLAIDLNLFNETGYLTSVKEYEPLGLWWESQKIEGITFCWGGHWGDADHFSFEYNGVR